MTSTYWLIGVGTTAVLAYLGRHRILSLGRYLMVAILFGAALPHVAKACAALLGPTLRTLAVDKAMLRVVLGKVADSLQGKVVTYATMGVAPASVYTAQEQQDLVEGIRDSLTAVLAQYNFAVPDADVGKLLDAITVRAFPTGA